MSNRYEINTARITKIIGYDWDREDGEDGEDGEDREEGEDKYE